MPKNIEDIIPSGKKSIRSIPIPIRKMGKTEKARVVEEEIEIQREIPQTTVGPDVRTRSHDSSPKKKVFLASAVGVIALIFALLSAWDGATLTYTPKKASITFADEALSAHQAPGEGRLLYSVVKLSGDKSVNVTASGEETVSEKASGTVIVYNEQSSAQTLVATTRLQTADGKIYRIPKEIIVPAKGSIETTVMADVAGPTHNIALSDFTLPGLKGSAKFELVYARSKTAMTGGFTGTRKKVSEVDLANAKKSLEETLRGELLGQARAQMPADFILFPELAQVVYEVLPVESAGETSAKVTFRGHLNAVIFKRSDLSNFLTLKKLAVTPSGATIADFSTLNLTLASNQSADISKSETLSLKAAGTVVARYTTDEGALAQDLVGINEKTGLAQVLAKYTSIESADSAIRPFWKSTFPSEVTKIKIEPKE